MEGELFNIVRDVADSFAECRVQDVGEEYGDIRIYGREDYPLSSAESAEIYSDFIEIRADITDTLAELRFSGAPRDLLDEFTELRLEADAVVDHAHYNMTHYNQRVSFGATEDLCILKARYQDLLDRVGR